MKKKRGKMAKKCKKHKNKQAKKQQLKLGQKQVFELKEIDFLSQNWDKLAKNGQKIKNENKNPVFETEKVELKKELSKNIDFASQNWGEKVFELKKVEFPRESIKFYFVSQNWGKNDQIICQISF